MKRTIAFLACLMILLAGFGQAIPILDSPFQDTVVVEAQKLPRAGQDFSIKLTPLRKGLTVAVSMELNGVRLNDVKASRQEDGTYTVTVPIPRAAISGHIRLSVAATGSRPVVRTYPLSRR